MNPRAAPSLHHFFYHQPHFHDGHGFWFGLVVFNNEFVIPGQREFHAVEYFDGFVPNVASTLAIKFPVFVFQRKRDGDAGFFTRRRNHAEHDQQVIIRVIGGMAHIKGDVVGCCRVAYNKIEFQGIIFIPYITRYFGMFPKNRAFAASCNNKKQGYKNRCIKR